MAGGAIALAQAWAKRRDERRWAPPEPEFTVSVLLILTGAAYLTAAAISTASSEVAPYVVLAAVFVIMVLGLLIITKVVRGAELEAEKRARRERSVLEPSVLEADALVAGSGLSAVFEGSDDPRLVETLTQDAEAAVTIRIWVQDADSLFTRSTDSVARLVNHRLMLGDRVTLICNTPPVVPIPHTATVVVTPVDLPEFWILEASGIVYVGVATEVGGAGRGQVLRLKPGRDVTRSDPLHAFVALLDRAEREARAESLQSRVVLSRGPRLYRQHILQLETGARQVDRVAKRVFVIFKDRETIEEIAKQRYGTGSSYLQGYVDEHTQRRTVFLDALSSGLVCREIYSIDELRSYISSRRHGSSATLGTRHARSLLSNWKQGIASLPNYHVGITNEPIPFKYELVDRTSVVMHEAIGLHESERINAIMVHSAPVAEVFQSEFDSLWDRIPVRMRTPKDVITWIEGTLEPLLLDARSDT